jgi:hypothetical protein
MKKDNSHLSKLIVVKDYLQAGLSNLEIAEKLSCSTRTVERYKSRIKTLESTSLNPEIQNNVRNDAYSELLEIIEDAKSKIETLEPEQALKYYRLILSAIDKIIILFQLESQAPVLNQINQQFNSRPALPDSHEALEVLKDLSTNYKLLYEQKKQIEHLEHQRQIEEY